MASQQGPPPRSWFRLGSMARPAGPPTPAPAPPAPIPTQPQAQPVRPPLLRPTFTFRPPTTQPPPPQQQPLQPPPPPVAAPPPPPPVVPLQATITTTSSVPTSPVIRASASSSSMPTSPAAPRSSSSPKIITSGPSSSLPTSPASPPQPSSVPASPPTATGTTTDRVATPKFSPKFAKPLEKTPPPSPKTIVSSTASLLPTSSAPPPPSITTIVARTETTRSSPKNVKTLEKTPTPSPKNKPISHPPSPLVLPPAQIKSYPEPETEKKTVLVQETIEKPKIITKSPNGEFRISQNGKLEDKKNGKIKEKSDHKKSSNSEEFGMSMITIAGENRGAVMEFSPSRTKHGFGGNPKILHQNGKSVAAGSDDEKSGSDYDEEGRLKMKNKNQETGMKTPNWTKYMNSNVQGVNNSILLNSSSTHHDPGVHVSLSRKINGNGHGAHRKE